MDQRIYRSLADSPTMTKAQRERAAWLRYLYAKVRMNASWN